MASGIQPFVITFQLSKDAVAAALLGQTTKELREFRGLLKPYRGPVIVGMHPMDDKGMTVEVHFQPKDAGIDTSTFPGW